QGLRAGRIARQHDGFGAMLAGQAESRAPSTRDDAVGPAGPYRVERRPGAVRIGVDDQDRALIGLQAERLLREGVDGLEGAGGGAAARQRCPVRRRLVLLVRGSLAQRHEQREPAAPARLRFDVDLTSEQAGDLPGDRQPEAGAAVLARGRAVRLLERLEDRMQLVLGDAHARVDDGEADHLLCTAQRLAAEADGRGRIADRQRDAAYVRELDRVREEVLQDLAEALLV